jgi:hypothetical protein
MTRADVTMLDSGSTRFDMKLGVGNARFSMGGYFRVPFGYSMGGGQGSSTQRDLLAIGKKWWAAFGVHYSSMIHDF